MTDVIALIGARSGSKGVPGKNIRMLGGRPLLAYSIMAAAKAGLDRVFVSTDSVEYAEIAAGYRAKVIMQPADTAQDHSGDYPFIANALSWFGGDGAFFGDARLIVHLRPTTPLRNPEKIVGALRAMTLSDDENWHHGEPTALRSVQIMPESAYKCFEVERGRLKMVGVNQFDIETANGPRQTFPTTVQANGYVDVLRTDFIRANHRLHGDRVSAYVTPPVVEVDAEEDFEMLEYQISKDPTLVTRLFG